MHQRAIQTQHYGSLMRLPISSEENVRAENVDRLGHVLADSITLRDMYQQYGWQSPGSTFYQLHLLFEKHYKAQARVVDAIAERIQMLGGLAIGMGDHVSRKTNLPHLPRGREQVSVQLSRLLEAHELLIREVRLTIQRSAVLPDQGTTDRLVSGVLRVNERQVWVLAEHLAGTPETR